jgi:hypothetical protein
MTSPRSFVAGLLLLGVPVALAQPEAPPTPDRKSLTRLEIGAGTGGWLSIEDGPAGFAPSLKMRLGATARTAFEIVGDFRVRDDGFVGSYAIVLHQSVGRGASHIQPFLAFGTRGEFRRTRIGEQRLTLSTGETLITPRYTKGVLTFPAGVTFGAGLRVAAAPRLFVEPELTWAFVEGGPVIAFHMTLVVAVRR